jgi:hypothetical protein
MHHAVDLVQLERGTEGRQVGEVHFDEGVGIAEPLLQIGQAVTLQLHGIVWIEVVDSNDLLASGQQAHRCIVADKSSPARHQNGHAASPENRG